MYFVAIVLLCIIVFFGCIIYADDIILLSPSIIGLQAMLDVYAQYIFLSQYCKLNSKKSIFTIVDQIYNAQVAPPLVRQCHTGMCLAFRISWNYIYN